jgi:hypothetical protein
MEWINVAQDSEKWRTLVDKTMELWASQTMEKLFV